MFCFVSQWALPHPLSMAAELRNARSYWNREWAPPELPNYSYGNGKAIGIGVGAAAGAAVGIALYIHHRHVKANEEAQAVQTPKSEASDHWLHSVFVNGVTLKNENDNLTYTILSSGSTKLQPGQRVELQGAVLNEKSGINAFSVHQLVDNYGACGSSAVVAQKTGDDKGTLASKLN